MNEQEDIFPDRRAVLKHVNSRVRDDAISCWNRLLDIDRGIWLWVFALFAQNFAPLSRWAFANGMATRHWRNGAPRRRRRDRVSNIGADIGTGMSLLRLRRSRPSLRAISNDEARAPVADLLPLFSGERTFAVSRQVDYRDWKQWIFTMAPFALCSRAEAAQTLAPVSDLLLVDRRKLLALAFRRPSFQVPHGSYCLESGGAGCDPTVFHGAREIEPRLGRRRIALRGAEFVTRVLADPQLRALGPVEPDLSRGNIVFAIGRNRNPSDRRSVLVVSPYLPYPLSHGARCELQPMPHARIAGGFPARCFREKNDTVHYDKLQRFSAKCMSSTATRRLCATWRCRNKCGAI